MYNSYNNGYNETSGGKNRRLSEEEKQKISKFMSDTRKGKNNSQHKEVICLNTMKVFDTIKEAANWCHIAPENIGKCCNNKADYSGIHPDTKELLFWSFLKDFDEKKFENFLFLKEKYKYKRDGLIKRVQQYDLNGNFIAEYENNKIAAITVFNDAKKSKGISKCASGQGKTAHGYIWRYIYD